MDSVSYYDKNSQDFYDRTIDTDMQEVYQRLLPYLPPQARILDAGCGVGRDSKFFLTQGYDVLPLDASLEMVKIASQLLGKPAVKLLFQDIAFHNEFDAVWANASLLHVPYSDLKKIFQLLHHSLRPSGIFYASFKYGTSMRQVEERYFFDRNEANILPYLEGLFLPLEIWKSADTRSKVAASPDKSWLHFISKRID